jgi:hypothetical protein
MLIFPNSFKITLNNGNDNGLYCCNLIVTHLQERVGEEEERVGEEEEREGRWRKEKMNSRETQRKDVRCSQQGQDLGVGTVSKACWLAAQLLQVLGSFSRRQ